jgi:hypothetical protein
LQHGPVLTGRAQQALRGPLLLQHGQVIGATCEQHARGPFGFAHQMERGFATRLLQHGPVRRVKGRRGPFGAATACPLRSSAQQPIWMTQTLGTVRATGDEHGSD